MDGSHITGKRYVITGAPSAGKSTTIQALAARGHVTGEDSARVYIEERLAAGESLQDIRADNYAFQSAILDRRSAMEGSIETEETAFLDFSVRDTAAFLRWSDHEPSSEHLQVIDSFRYETAFLLEFAEFEEDNVRTETPADSKRLEVLIRRGYEEAGIPVVWVPWKPVDERVDQILDHIKD